MGEFVGGRLKATKIRINSIAINLNFCKGVSKWIRQVRNAET